MKHICKKQWLGCGIAVAAMLAGVDYDEAAVHWPDLDDADLRRPKELGSLLESLTEIRWDVSECWHPAQSIREFPATDSPVALFIQDSEIHPHFAQWIVLKGEVVHDPGLPRQCIVSQYPRQDWVVTWTANPMRKVKSMRYQEPIGSR